MGTGEYAVALADFDRDGRRDIVTRKNYGFTGNTRVYFQRPDGLFSSSEPQDFVDLHGYSPYDLATGEDVWRFAERGCFQLKPLVSHETVVAAAARGPREGALFAIDLYSGQPRWEQPLDGPPTSDPCAAGGVTLVSKAGDEACLSAHCLETGAPVWETKDPGLGIGGAGLAVDETWVVNAPFGQLSALDVKTGEVRWSCNLADALADEIPRRLEPVLRGGALFVPASSVHVVRPADGQKLSASLPCDLVPDLMRVDERGWVYVAEESGYLAAYAPKPMLTLIKGGTR